MELGLRGKSVVVTGGGSNIGRAIDHAFAAEGSNITIGELAPSQGDKVAAEVAATGSASRVKLISADGSDQHQGANIVAKA